MENSDTFKEIKSLNWIDITDNEFELLQKLVYQNIGINLTAEKKNLLMGRLQKILRQRGFDNFRDYYNYIIRDKSGDALSELANSISTNHTFFYREHDHFDFFFKKTLPDLENFLKTYNTLDIRIWSAGCSSGEEPYFLIMLMMEYFGSNYRHMNAGILATDISEKALLTARRGIYTTERMRYLPDLYKKKYFNKISEDEWEVSDQIKKEVTFRRFNLMNTNFPFKKKFYTIFCRNVMIYFDSQTRNSLVDKFYGLTEDGGYLFIGHSESLPRDVTPYKYLMPALYQKK